MTARCVPPCMKPPEALCKPDWLWWGLWPCCHSGYTTLHRKRAQALLQRVSISSLLRFLGGSHCLRVACLAAAETLQRDRFAAASAFFFRDAAAFIFLFYLLLLFSYDCDAVTAMSHMFTPTNPTLYYYSTIITSTAPLFLFFILGSPTAAFSAHTPLVRESNISR